MKNAILILVGTLFCLGSTACGDNGQCRTYATEYRINRASQEPVVSDLIRTCTFRQDELVYSCNLFGWERESHYGSLADFIDESSAPGRYLLQKAVYLSTDEVSGEKVHESEYLFTYDQQSRPQSINWQNADSSKYENETYTEWDDSQRITRGVYDFSYGPDATCEGMSIVATYDDDQRTARFDYTGGDGEACPEVFYWQTTYDENMNRAETSVFYGSPAVEGGPTVMQFEVVATQTVCK